MKDSDGDKKSNGEELGDPHCRWTEGDTPQGPSIGQPGMIIISEYSSMLFRSQNLFSHVFLKYIRQIHKIVRLSILFLQRTCTVFTGFKRYAELQKISFILFFKGICEPVGSGACASVVFACGCQGQACVSN